MLIEHKLYSLDDVTIVPGPESFIRHRKEINPFTEDNKLPISFTGDGRLPIFVSPMECVINENNYRVFEYNNTIPILPRTVDIEIRKQKMEDGVWVAFGLEQFEELFVNNAGKPDHTYRILIDIANGHIKTLATDISKAKANAINSGYELIIMAGNVANPDTYRYLSEAGADYVRVSVGTGNCCITSSNTAVHYPMASLINACNEQKVQYDCSAKIVADGGINSYSRAIKALALGADYVMIGSLFGSCFESASDIISFNKDHWYGFPAIDTLNDIRYTIDNVFEKQKKDAIKQLYPIKKTVWGMSTRRAQTSIAKAEGKTNIKTKTSEGVEKEVVVEYTLHQWIENFTDYLRSSMSYCNCKCLQEFVGKQTLYILSEGAKASTNK